MADDALREEQKPLTISLLILSRMADDALREKNHLQFAYHKTSQKSGNISSFTGYLPD